MEREIHHFTLTLFSRKKKNVFLERFNVEADHLCGIGKLFLNVKFIRGFSIAHNEDTREVMAR